VDDAFDLQQSAKKAIQVNERWLKSRFSEKEIVKLVEMLTRIHE
jgi:hypothetical protein